MRRITLLLGLQIGLLLGPLALGPARAAEAGASDRPGVAALALGLLEFTRWPRPPDLLCVSAGGPQAKALAAALPEHPLSSRLSLREVPVDAELPAGCDAMLFEGWTEERQAQALRENAERPVLTLGLGAGFCTLGGAVCFGEGRGQPAFEINTDALARSGLRVNPRVLLLTRARKPAA